MDKNVLINNNVVRLQDANKTVLNLDRLDMVSFSNTDEWLVIMINGNKSLVYYTENNSLLEDYKQLSEYMWLNAE